jgi:hypothetical protein
VLLIADSAALGRDGLQGGLWTWNEKAVELAGVMAKAHKRQWQRLQRIGLVGHVFGLFRQRNEARRKGGRGTVREGFNGGRAGPVAVTEPRGQRPIRRQVGRSVRTRSRSLGAGQRHGRLTLGADKGYDAAGFVADLHKACVTPHVAQKSRHSAIDGRTTRHEGYAQSIKHRKRIDLRRDNDPPDRCLILLTFGWA